MICCWCGFSFNSVALTNFSIRRKYQLAQLNIMYSMCSTALSSCIFEASIRQNSSCRKQILAKGEQKLSPLRSLETGNTDIAFAGATTAIGDTQRLFLNVISSACTVDQCIGKFFEKCDTS